MGSSFETLVFEIITKDAQAAAAWDRFRNKVDQTSKSVDASSKSLDANARSLDKNRQANVSALGALVGLGAAFPGVAVGAAAAGAGVAAFGALALPSVKKVSAALTAKGGLAESWVTLDNRQRNAALGVQALGADYADLAKKMEPQLFQVFNQGLSLAHSLLGPTGQLARTSGQGISDFLATFSASSGLQHFITYLSTVARPAIGLVGSDVTHVAHAVLALAQGVGGTALIELRALTGVFTALDDSISFLSQHAPGLTSAGLAIGGIALALSKLGLLSGALRLTGLSAAAAGFTDIARAAGAANVAEKGMLATQVAFESITPWGWAALGVGAMGALIFSLRNVRSGLQDAIAAEQSQDKAAGFNIAGWQKLAKQAGATAGAWQHNIATSSALGHQISIATATQNAYSASSAHAAGVANTLSGFLGVLQAKYGLTQAQAIKTAVSAGVLIDKQGNLVLGLGKSITKTEAWSNANVTARAQVTQLTADLADFSNQTLTATQRQTALTNALKVFFDPAVKADESLITLAGDAQAAAVALAASGGKTRGLTGAQGAARQAFDTYLQQTADTATAVFSASGKTSDYNRIIDANLPRLERMARGNAALRGEIQKLIGTMKGLTPENVRLSVGATGTWTVTQFQAPGGGRHTLPVAAQGMFIGTGRPGVDDQLILAQRGEVVVPPHLVRSGAVDHLRGRIPGFADGGVVGAYQGTVPGLGRFLRAEDSATLAAVERSVAMAVLAGIHAAAAAARSFAGAPPGSSGTAVGAVQQWARAHLADYGWGPGQFPPLQALWNRESGWRWNALNPSSGAYGIPQALPASKMASAGADWRTNPVTQMRWGLPYIGGTYGSPAGAWAHELAAGWYGGGLQDALFTRPTLIGVAERGPEVVNVTPGRRSGGDVIINVTVKVGHGTSPRQAAREIADILNQGATAGIRLRKSILSASG